MKIPAYLPNPMNLQVAAFLSAVTLITSGVIMLLSYGVSPKSVVHLLLMESPLNKMTEGKKITGKGEITGRKCE